MSIQILTGEQSLNIERQPGETLLELLRRAALPFTAPCGGAGTCGRCRVHLADSAGEREVLACQTPAPRSGVLTVPQHRGGAILGESAVISSITPGRQGLGAAVDLGTTTVVLELLDLSNGHSLGMASAWNALAPYGADVISRCQYCMEHPDGLAELQTRLLRQLHDMLKELGVRAEDLRETVIAGNTVMQHLHAGLSPAGIAVAPFRPTTLFTEKSPEDGLFYAPCVAGYVGGDITAGLLASGLPEREERSLFLDIGTNGEMALGGKEGFLCCAVASGPAFEGVGIRCGMAGTTGAVSHVRWTDSGPELTVIGGGEPIGICGSGLIDLLALLCEKRVISASGLLLGPEEAPEGFEAWLGEDDNGNGVFYLTEDQRLFLTAKDVRQLQLAKAAVAAGIRVLMKETGMRLEDVEHLYLAGGFGTYMDVQSAAAIGMLPQALVEKTVLLQNSSLAGARMALLNTECRAKLNTIRQACRYLELSGNAEFNREYPEQMYFYEEDEDEWN